MNLDNLAKPTHHLEDFGNISVIQGKHIRLILLYIFLNEIDVYTNLAKPKFQ